MPTFMASTYAGRCDLFDAGDQLSLTGSTGAIKVRRTVNRQRVELTPQSFRRMTSCHITFSTFSNDRSATIFFGFPFSSSDGHANEKSCISNDQILSSMHIRTAK
jgi:hypothetical protein